MTPKEIKDKIANTYDHTHGVVGVYNDVKDGCAVVLTNKIPPNIKSEIERLAEGNVRFEESGPIRALRTPKRE